MPCTFSYQPIFPPTGIETVVNGNNGYGPTEVAVAPLLDLIVPTFIEQREITYTFTNTFSDEISITQPSAMDPNNEGPFTIQPGLTTQIRSQTSQLEETVSFTVSGECCATQTVFVKTYIFQCDDIYLGTFAQDCDGKCVSGCASDSCGFLNSTAECGKCNTTIETCGGYPTCECVNNTALITPVVDFATSKKRAVCDPVSQQNTDLGQENVYNCNAKDFNRNPGNNNNQTVNTIKLALNAFFAGTTPVLVEATAIVNSVSAMNQSGLFFLVSDINQFNRTGSEIRSQAEGVCNKGDADCRFTGLFGTHRMLQRRLSLLV